MLSELKPRERLLVHDLVRAAGIDTADWANYAGKNPTTNPKYCYEWAFWDEAKKVVAVCLWHSQLKSAGAQVYQHLNYRALADASGRDPSASVRANRARRMDMAFQLAAKRQLPVRVIVVDGVRRGESGADASFVERRLLDPLPWSVAAYDLETGACHLIRNGNANGGDHNGSENSHRLARIAFNSSGWQRPTGEAGDQESSETYNAKNRFGHEDWLFRNEWQIDGWRYAFIQGLNNSRQTYLGRPLNVTLFTIQPDKRRRLVATIYGMETLSDEQAKAALATFRDKGWLKTMQNEVSAIGGAAEALGSPRWAEHVLNIRFRLENVDTYPTDTFLADDDWIRDRHRYMLYRFEEAERELVARAMPKRRGVQHAPDVRQLFRRGTKPVEYTPEHNKMQATLLAELQQEFGAEHAWLERDFVDAVVETADQLIFFEIKTDLEARAVIRQALGQILEYAYHPIRTGRCPDKLVIVGRCELRPDDRSYLKHLSEKFFLPVSYRVVSI